MEKIKLVKTIKKLATITMVMAIVPSHAGTVISGSVNNGSSKADTTNTANCTHGTVVFTYNGIYGYDGSPQYFTITPEMRAYGKLCFTLYGASGGNTQHFRGGNGGVTTAVLPLQNFPSNTLTIIVGGAGRDCYYRYYYLGGGGGGGGTFVCSGSSCSKNTVLLAAGGGGGAGEYISSLYYDYWGGHGGHGGGIKGGDATGGRGSDGGRGGTNISGGLGYGSGGSGGGGWYGGGGGAGGGGGGGSGYCNPIFGQIPGASCTTDFSNHRGHGHVIISW
jgi:hypothetical protein